MAKGRQAAKAEEAYQDVMLRLSHRHRDALQDAARELRDSRAGKGKAAASEVARALLDDWIEAGAKLPKRLLEQ
jgi:hypothetical protein